MTVVTAGCSTTETGGQSTPTVTASPPPTDPGTRSTNDTRTSTATVSSTAQSTPTLTATSPRTATPQTRTRQRGITVTVYEVVDGDTLKVRYRNGNTETLRLLGVDTPEVHVANDPEEFEGVPNTPTGERCLREEGHDASEYVKRTVLNERIRLVFDERADRRDAYGRLLVYAFLDDRNINYQLVAQGYARVYDSRFSQSERFYRAETRAQTRQQGVWRCRSIRTSTPTPTANDTGTGELVIAEIHEDASGNDHDNLNDEYVVFENVGDDALDLSEWIVRDEADHIYRFPNGFTLDPGARVTLYTGSGTDTASRLYWGSERAIWNNGGDTVIVTRSDGEIAVRHEFE